MRSVSQQTGALIHMTGLLRWCVALIAAVFLFGSAIQAEQTSAPLKLKYSFVAYGYSSGQRFSRAAGLFYDAKRAELYVADTGNGQIVILDNKGMPVSRIRHFIYAATDDKRQLGEPKSIVVRKNGDILVTDNLAHYVDVMDYRGRSVEKVWPGDLLGRDRSKVRPGYLALDASGNVYLSVTGDVNAILVLTPSLKLKAQMGKIGGGRGGGFKAVTGLWVDKHGKIYATYSQGECVRIYRADGRLLTSFGGHDSGPGNFSLPSGIVTDGKDNIWVVDSLRQVMSIFSQETDGSKVTTSFMELIGRWGRGPGEFDYPTDITGDGKTKIFVLEGTGARVQAFEILTQDESDNSQ